MNLSSELQDLIIQRPKIKAGNSCCNLLWNSFAANINKASSQANCNLIPSPERAPKNKKKNDALLKLNKQSWWSCIEPGGKQARWNWPSYFVNIKTLINSTHGFFFLPFSWSRNENQTYSARASSKCGYRMHSGGKRETFLSSFNSPSTDRLRLKIHPEIHPLLMTNASSPSLPHHYIL